MNKQLLLLSAVALLTACQSEELAETKDSGDVQHVRMEVKDYVWTDGEGDTRTSAALDGNSITFRWQQGDVVGIFGNVGDQVSFPVTSGFDQPTAEFDGGAWALKSGCTYVAYFPHVYENRDRTAIPVHYTGQTQTGNGSVAHLAQCDHLVSNMTAPAAGAVNFLFEHVSCVVRFKLTVPEADTFTRLTLTAPNNVFASEQWLNLTTGELTDRNTSKQTALYLSGISTSAANEVVTLYLMLAPVDLSDTQLAITLTGEKGTYAATLTGKRLDRGAACAFAATLAKGSTLDLDDELGADGMIGGHEYVDLGIRKSDYDPTIIPGSADDRRVVFATCNIGASSPEETGYYFRWGEQMGWRVTTTSGNNSILQARQYDKDGSRTAAVWTTETFAVKNWELYDQYIDDFQGKTNLVCDGQVYGDAATFNWGEPWMIPTATLWNYLLPQYTARSTRPTSYTHNGQTISFSYDSRIPVNIQNNTTLSSLTLPVCGYCSATQLNKSSFSEYYTYYWSSTPSDDLTAKSLGSLYEKSGDYTVLGTKAINRYYAICIRPIAELPL